MLEQYNDVITPEELREILHIGRNSLYRLLQENVIANKRIGKKYVIPKSSVIKFLTC